MKFSFHVNESKIFIFSQPGLKMIDYACVFTLEKEFNEYISRARAQDSKKLRPFMTDVFIIAPI